jgi:2-polyprenyl-3-methyl-5-hydroxy-6-metoxy-1,4-benzoquinol methylase
MKNKYLHPVSCPLCGKNEYKVLFPSTLTTQDFDLKLVTSGLKNTLDDYRKHSRIVKCRSCGLVYTNPMEDFPYLLQGYEGVVDREYLETEKFRKILSKQHLENIEEFTTKGKILDIGCFTGYFLELAKERGWDTYGIEPSHWAGKIAQKRNIKIIAEDIESSLLSKNFFDVITMWDVIEHLPNPIKTLQKCHKYLKKDGILAVGTPNIESFIAKVLRSNNPHLVRMHLILYSPKTLTKILEQTGFKSVRTYSYGRTFPVSYVLDISLSMSMSENHLL